jgi:acetyltransferase-like isoleucine patch superfamily enzyme
MIKLLKLLYNEMRVRIWERFILLCANLITISPSLPCFFIKSRLLRLVGVKIEYPCFIDKGFDCWSPRNISTGKNCSFGHHNRFWAFNKITIGPYVQTALGVTLVAGGHDTSDYTDSGENQDIIIEGENWIGANVTIIGGVTIGRGAIIAAGAVVTTSIPPYCIAGGVPAKVLKQRSPSEFVHSPFGKYKPVIHSQD